MPPIPKIILKPDKEKPVLARHPWIFSGAIDGTEGSYQKGDVVVIQSARGDFLGKGYFNPNSQIAVRILTFNDETIDTDFFKRRIDNALAARKEWIPQETNAYRLIHSEGDFLSGLIVDRYADFLVVQLLTAGMERLQDQIVAALEVVIHPKGIFEKDDSEARAFEGLPERLAILKGEAPPELIEIKEYGNKFLVDVHGGQKTGFYLDQRENRRLVTFHSANKRVLNCFGYTGGFSVYAAKGDANEIITVESSQEALRLAERNMTLNGFDSPRFKYLVEDVFDFLRREQKAYDLIVLDPPAFAPTKGSVMQATRGYKDINRLALKLLSPGGLLFTYSCSHHIDSLLFQKVLFAAAKDAAVNVRILEKTSNPFDHPVNIYHPEGEYLKGFVLVKSE